ncbi:MAG TPA: hypothetical protein VGF70_02455 [Solirubrobacteraceae bacterium]|jgi:hypothetical protein
MTRSRLLGGGTAGNEQLTAVTGVLLIVLLAVLGVTILFIGRLIWLHLFLGLALLGPIVLKIASTGYRFVRYYTRERTYVAKGPPHLLLRALGPGVVLTTLVVFVSGIVLMLQGPSDRHVTLLIHKVSFFAWLAFTGLHVLGHLPGLGRSLQAVRAEGPDHGLGSADGAAGRWIVLIGAVLAGVVLAVALIPHFSVWTAAGAFPHHGEH